MYESKLFIITSTFSATSGSSFMNYSEGINSSSNNLELSGTFGLEGYKTADMSYFEPNILGELHNMYDVPAAVDIPSGQAFKWRARIQYDPVNAIDGRLNSRWYYPGMGDQHPYNFRLDEGCYETGFCESIPYEEPQSVDETVVDDMTTAVYPSPATSQLNLKINHVDGQARILSIDGKEMLTHINLTNGTTQVDISSLPEGMYLVEITTSEGTSVHKFRKE